MTLALGFIFLCHDYKRKLGVSDYDALHANPAGAPAANDFDLRAVEIRTGQLATMRLRRHRRDIASAVLDIQHLLHVLHP